MGNPNPKTEHLNETRFVEGHEKVGGRKKGTPNKITGQIILDRLSDRLQETHISNENGKEIRTTHLDIVLTGLLIKAEVGDPKAIDLIFKAYGIPANKLELSGEVKTDIPTDQIFAEIGALANAVGNRTSADDSATD